MSLLVGLMSALGILLWPGNDHRRRLVILPGMSASVLARRPHPRPWQRWRRRLRGRPADGVTAHDLLGLLEAIAPALDAGLAPVSALRIAAEARSGSGNLDPLAALADEISSAAADGARLGPLWREAADSAGSAELLLLAQAWSLTEDMGVPLAQSVRTAIELLEARIAHEQRLAGAVAGARATVNVLTVLPVGGPLLGLVLGIGPGRLYGGSRITQMSLALGLCLAGIGRWCVRRMVRTVTRGPMIS